MSPAKAEYNVFINLDEKLLSFICSKNATNGQSRADFYVLCDAIFYINLDGTASVSV